MQIAELFVALGVKGSEKTLSALANTRLTLSSISTTALEAKVAILGMAYALEKLTTGAATDASDLKGFAAFIDSSAEAVERWEYAGKRAGLSFESMRNSLGGVYKMIQDNETTPGKLPFGAKVFAEETQLNTTVPLNYEDILRKAVQFAHSKRYPQPVINAILASLGLGADLIGRIESGQFKLSDVDHAPILSNKEIDSLANVKSQFADIEEKVRLFFGHFTSKHGTEIVKIIRDMTDAFLALATVLDEIATKLHAFEIIDKYFKALKTVVGFGKDVIEGKRNEKNFLSRNLIPSNEDTINLIKSIQQDYKISRALNNLPSLGQGIEDFLTISKSNFMGGFGEFKKDIPSLFNRNPHSLFNENPTNSLPQRYNLSPQNNVNVTQHLSLNGDPTHYNDMQNMQKNSLQRAIVDTMSQFNRGRQT